MKTKNKRVISVILSAVLVFLSVSMPVSAITTEIAEAEEYVNHGLLPETDGWSLTLPQYVSPRTSNSGNMSRSASEDEDELPSSVDLSTSPYFPAIGDQGQTGSCTAFATTYYQYTYEANKLQNVVTTTQNTYCPQYTYSSRFWNSGMSFGEAYESFNTFGCLKYSDYDSSIDLSDPDVFDYYISNNTAAKLAAMELKTEYYSVKQFSLRNENNERIPIITFDTGLETDNSFEPLKQALNDGKILTIALNFNVTIDEASDLGTHEGEKIIIRAVNGILKTHSLAIVGYDDNICYDSNKDGIIESSEKGAFKIANSYGTDYGNDGYIWILYDAFNPVSQNSNSTWEERYSNGRGHLLAESSISSYGITYYYNIVYSINITQHKPMFILKADVQSSDIFEFAMHPGRKSNTGSAVYNVAWYRTNVVPFPQIQYNGSILMDYSTLYDPISTYRTGFDWGAQFGYTDPTKHTITSLRVIDNLGNVITSIEPGTLPSVNEGATSATYSVFEDIDIELGDLNYDGVIDADDITMFSSGISNQTPLSYFQIYLADLNGDGRLTSRDLLLLRQLIDPAASLSDAEIQMFLNYELEVK